MKRRLLIILSLIILLPSCFRHNAISLASQARGVIITVDPRVELYMIVLYLSDWEAKNWFLTSNDFPYKRNVAKYFSPYKNHPAVIMCTELANDGFEIDDALYAMVQLSEPPELNIKIAFDDFEAFCKEAIKSTERLDEFVALLRDFAEKTDFMKFLESNQGFFNQAAEDMLEKIKNVNYIDTMEHYFGMKQHSYNIVMVPLLSSGPMFGPSFIRFDGLKDLYCIIGPRKIANGFMDFGEEIEFREYIWHEFGHSFVNPTVDKFINQVNQYEILLYPIAKKMKQQAYPEWRSCVIEHVVRVTTTRLTYREIGPTEGEEHLLKHKERGFIYIEALCEGLEQKYENNREKYPTFVDFFPELINVFKELSEKELK